MRNQPMQVRVRDSRDRETIFTFQSLESAREVVRRELRRSPGYVAGLKTYWECCEALCASGKWFDAEFQPQGM